MIIVVLEIEVEWELLDANVVGTSQESMESNRGQYSLHWKGLMLDLVVLLRRWHNT